MRVQKETGWVASPVGGGYWTISKVGSGDLTRTYYDGQFPVEEDVSTSGTVSKVTSNFVGARGMEAITATVQLS